MDGDIVFYIHGSTVEYGGTLFDAGELTTDILNLGPREYALTSCSISCPWPGSTRAHRTVALGSELLSDRTAQTVEQVPGVSNPAAG